MSSALFSYSWFIFQYSKCREFIAGSMVVWMAWSSLLYVNSNFVINICWDTVKVLLFVVINVHWFLQNAFIPVFLNSWFLQNAFIPVFLNSWFLQNAFIPVFLNSWFQTTTDNNWWKNCISSDFYFCGLSEPRNPRKLEPHD